MAAIVVRGRGVLPFVESFERHRALPCMPNFQIITIAIPVI